MINLMSNIKIAVNDKIYIKDPETSDLGRKIIQESINLIDDIGFENFTFKKLGEKIQSNESSIYRYFENKHKLMVYLSSRYWAWIEYKMVFSISNIKNPIEQLKIAIDIVTQNIEDDAATLHIDEEKLNRIVIAEFTKTLMTKEVAEEDKDGYYSIYKRIIQRLVELIEKINPQYKSPKTLISSVVAGSLHQHFLKRNLTDITECSNEYSPSTFFTELILKQIQN